MSESIFGRIVLGISHRPIDRAIMRFAADFADLLDIDLLGLLVHDAPLLETAGLPFVREFRSVEGKWSQLEPERLASEAEFAAVQNRRQLFETMRDSKARLSFASFTGDETSALSEVVRKDDIVLIPELYLAQTALMHAENKAETALRTRGSVLIVPRKVTPQRGPILSIARDPHERGLVVAASIASAAKTNLLVVDVGEENLTVEDVVEQGRSEALSISTVRASRSCIEAGAIPALDFSGSRERLIVTTRGVLDDTLAATTALKRAVPVLVANSA
jgi:hypothetical protein